VGTSRACRRSDDRPSCRRTAMIVVRSTTRAVSTAVSDRLLQAAGYRVRAFPSRRFLDEHDPETPGCASFSISPCRD